MLAHSNDDTQLPVALPFPDDQFENSEEVNSNSLDHLDASYFESIFDSMVDYNTALGTSDRDTDIAEASTILQHEFSGSAAPAISATESPLGGRACSVLPPSGILKQLFEAYFSFVHPHIPIISESEISAFWATETFSVGDFPVVVLWAMLFSTTQVRCLYLRS